MKTIRCLVGRIRAPKTAVPLPLRLDGREPSAYLNEAATTGAGPLLSLAMDYSQLDTVAGASEASSFFLHQALRDLTQNGPHPTCLKRVGLILADKYVDDEGAFGYMFDTGFDPATTDQSFNDVAREGCAIFLDAIREKRPVLDDYHTEVGFTAVHELGHIFNLWHVNTPSLMAQSKPSAPFKPDVFKFLKVHRTYLSELDSRFVCPGGSIFEDRGDLVIPPEGSFNGPTTQRVRVGIGLPQDTFWRFEPVQLDVTVSTATGVAEVRIPNVVDPGYDAFDIWIEAPDGTRQKYRSPVRYCANGRVLTIRKDQPFRRDVPLFGQSGGYTFKRAGLHRLFCTLRLPDGTVATSNAVEAFVKPPAPHKDKFKELEKVLTTRAGAQTLFYRNALRPSTVVEPLETAANTLKGTPAAANIRYSVARSLATSAKIRSPATRNKYERTAARLLNTALDSGNLSASRERRAVQTLDSFDRG